MTIKDQTVRGRCAEAKNNSLDALSAAMILVREHLDAPRLAQPSQFSAAFSAEGADDSYRSPQPLIHVYELPKHLEASYGRNTCKACTSSPGYKVEALVHRAVRSSSWNCPDASRARWFMVPLLYSCRVNCPNNPGTCHREHVAAYYVDRVVAWLQKSSQYWQRAPERHLFVWSQDKGGYRIAEHRASTFAQLRKGLFLQTVGAFMPGRPLAVEPAWDIVLPSTGTESVATLPENANELLQRKWRVFWRGTSHLSSYPIRAVFKQFVTHSSLRERFCVQKPSPTFFSELARETGFCLYLPGHLPQRWSGSLGHFLHASCLLVIADNYSALPFADTVPWGTVALLTREDRPSDIARLANISIERVDALLHAWHRVRPRRLFNVPARRGDAIDELVANLALREHQGVAWRRAHRRRCLQAVGNGHAFKLDADVRSMSQEQRDACCVGPTACSYTNDQFQSSSFLWTSAL